MLPQEFATALAPLAGFRNVLVHEYVALDWDLVYQHLARLKDFERFAGHVRTWLNRSVHRDTG